MMQIRFHNMLNTAQRTLCGFGLCMHPLRLMASLFMGVLLFTASCVREPELHLPYLEHGEIEFPLVDLDLKAYWTYELDYDWEAEWVYGWDGEDEDIFGPIGYTHPSVFNIRRYYTKEQPKGNHTSVLANTVKGNTFHGEYNWGYWDILVWSDVNPLHEEAQSLIFDETSSLDSVTASTNQSMRSSRFNAPKYTRAFYQPEQLFSAYDQAIEINRNLEGFVYDSLRNVYVKQLNMVLEPITYIYLTQVILHNNKNKIIGVDGASDISALARTTNLNTGVAGSDKITVTYNVRFKPSKKYKGTDEMVAVAGGRMMTFGICNQNGNRIKRLEDVMDTDQHFMDINMQFNNGMDSTFIFDITDQVRRRWKGGVITIELDMDTIPVPQRSGGSGFDAVVEDYKEAELPEFEM